MKAFEYYFDYQPNEYELLMKSTNLRYSEKQLLNDLIKGKTVNELATLYNCSKRTICTKRKEIFFKTKQILNNINANYGNDLITNDDRKHNKTYFVYMLMFPNDKVYIGQTLDTKTRWSGNGTGYKENKEMYEDIQKYGWNNIKKLVIDTDLTYEESLEREKELIIHYRSNIPTYGYNKIF